MSPVDRARRREVIGSSSRRLDLVVLALACLGLLTACGQAAAMGLTPGPAAGSTSLPAASATPPPKVVAGVPLAAVPTLTPRPTSSTTLPTPTATPEGTALILVGDNFFDPAAVTVPAGTAITWRAVGEYAHTIVAKDPLDAFKKAYSGGAGSPDVVLTFDEPGTYYYYCDYHPGAMDAVLVVTADG